MGGLVVRKGGPRGFQEKNLKKKTQSGGSVLANTKVLTIAKEQEETLKEQTGVKQTISDEDNSTVRRRSNERIKEG